MPPTTHKGDPAGIFASDTHRRVLGHLPTPDADVGYEVQPLLARLAQDPHTPFPADPGEWDVETEAEAVLEILTELADDGYCKAYKGGVYRMTKQGLEALTGPIANEPQPGEPIIGPADLGALAPANAKATPIG